MRDDIFEDEPSVGTNVDDGTSGGFLAIIGLLRGAVYGVAVWIVGFVLSFGIASSGAVGNLGTAGASLGADQKFQLAGWLFYGTHFVGTEITRTGETLSSGNLATELGGPIVALFVVMPALLLLAGRKLGSGNWSWRAGVALVAGYLPLTALGVIVFSPSVAVGNGFSTTTASPITPEAYLLMGIAYPAVFGAIGAWTAD